jgi:3-hydroxy-D-aspartate aldolase
MDADYAKNLREDGEQYDDFEQSLFVYATVMSRPSGVSGILDAGIKASSIDSGPPRMFGYDEVAWVGGGDEHGKFVASSGQFPFKLGDKVRLVPGHCDPTVNLYDWYVGVRNEQVEVIWPILARGMGR